MNLKRVIEWYHKNGDDEFLVADEVLLNIPEKLIQKLKNEIADNDDPEMICGYELKSKHLDLIRPYLKHTIDEIKYEYIICCRESSQKE